MYEVDVKKKWCPMSRVAVPAGLTVNRISSSLLKIVNKEEREYFEEQQANCNCIGSKCACWVWDDTNRAITEWSGHCGLTR